MKFTDICLITPDVLRLVRFYETVFGGKAEGDDVHSSLICAGLGIAIYNKGNAESDMGFNLAGAGTGLVTLGFDVDDVDAEYARIRAMNLPSTTEPHLWPWGAKSFWFYDPDGNILVFRTRMA